MASHESNVTWIGIGPALRLYRSFSHAKFALQLAAPISVMRPQFLLDHQDRPSDVYYQVPLAGAYVSLRATWETNNAADTRSPTADLGYELDQDRKNWR